MQSGLVIALALCVAALMVFTGNVISSFFAALTIALIIVNVCAITVYFGWPLGSSESTACVVCIGFAVDYVVHLAAHFTHST